MVEGLYERDEILWYCKVLSQGKFIIVRSRIIDSPLFKNK